MTSTIKPTIGRRVWFWTGGMENVRDQAQAFDAGVIFVNGDGTVDLSVTDHTGLQLLRRSVPLGDARREGPPDAHNHGHGDYATWMPYQQAQHAKQQAQPEQQASGAES